MDSIPFNHPSVTGREAEYVGQVVAAGRMASDGTFTQRCSNLLRQWSGSHSVLMTPSGTAALEVAALLCDFRPGDEVILPSFTFVSTANAFLRTGAKLVFVDICPQTLNLDPTLLEQAITPKTRAICPVHYAGVGCDMDRIGDVAQQHRILVVEDAAQGVGAYYRNRPLGSWGQFGCYSFHDTKNVQCGEGGAIAINDPAFVERAEIIRDKGTNRRKFFRGQVDKYTWMDVGSSYVPSELSCAFLAAQLEQMEAITARRREIFQTYYEAFAELELEGLLQRPTVPDDCCGNGHLFYLLLPDQKTRDGLIQHLRLKGIHAVFHYVPLHSSPMGARTAADRFDLPVTDDVSSRLVRLPLFFRLTTDQQDRVIAAVKQYAFSCQVNGPAPALAVAGI